MPIIISKEGVIIMTSNMKKTANPARLIAVFAGILSALFIFAPALSAKGYSFSGIDMAFGVKIAQVGIFKGIKSLCILAIIGYLFPLIAAGFLLMGRSRFSSIFASSLLLVSVILMLAMRTYVKLKVSSMGAETFKSADWTMLWGLIVSASLAAFAFFISVYEVYKSFK